MDIRCYARKELVNAWRREPALLEVKEAADLARVTTRTVCRWITEGSLAAVDKGFKGVLVPKTALINFMCGQTPEAPEEA
jgi:excisionase family DNA binding protein